MKTAKAKAFAQTYIKHHLGNDWSFRWDLKERRFGSTQFRQRIISLSRPITALNSEAQVLEALRHEIAHALTGEREHNDAWRSRAQALGSTGAAFIDRSQVTLPQKKRLLYL